MQLATTGLPNNAASIYNFGSQESAFGGRGITATALPIFGATTAPKSIMNFDSVILNTMALLLSIYDTDCREDGINDSEFRL